MSLTPAAVEAGVSASLAQTHRLYAAKGRSAAGLVPIAEHPTVIDAVECLLGQLHDRKGKAVHKSKTQFEQVASMTSTPPL